MAGQTAALRAAVNRPRGSGARFVPPLQATWRRYGRREPYTDAGVRRLPCFRCGQPAMHQWNACADDNLWHPLCLACDLALNELVLTWMGFEPGDVAAKLTAYGETGCGRR